MRVYERFATLDASRRPAESTLGRWFHLVPAVRLRPRPLRVLFAKVDLFAQLRGAGLVGGQHPTALVDADVHPETELGTIHT